MITFQSKDTGDILALGGTSTLGESEFGVVGPFPRYSISREEISTEDGTYINSKFTINVTGTATLKSGTSQDILVKGQRQAAVQGEAIILSQLNRNKWPMIGNGLLEIAPYGGLANKIKFNDARITSLELPEQNETAGIQNQEYTITFEAYDDDSSGGNDNKQTDADTTARNPTYALSNVQESWELVPSEDRYNYSSNNVEDASNAYRTFTLTHTISATGLKKLKSGDTGLATDGESWRQAAKYIGARLENTKDPTLDITSNTLNIAESDNSNRFNALQMDSDNTNFDYDLGTTDAYKAYNHVRTINSNVSAGSYTVTDTWLLAYANADAEAVTDIEVTVDQNAEEEANTVTVTGTINGLSTLSPESKTTDKYENAKAAYDTIGSHLKTLADNSYVAALGGTSSLRSIEINKNVGFNRTTGTITFSVSYNDIQTELSGAISDSVTVNDSGGTDVVAIIGVILRSAGPVIQDMGTITEKRRSVTYEAKMDSASRSSTPAGEGIVDTYKPAGTVYVSAKDESWNKDTGDYTFSKEWVYN